MVLIVVVIVDVIINIVVPDAFVAVDDGVVVVSVGCAWNVSNVSCMMRCV